MEISLLSLNENFIAAHLLVAAGADVNMRDSYGYTLLTRLLKQNQYTKADWLYSVGASIHTPNTKGYVRKTTLFVLVEYGNINAVSWLTRHGAVINDVEFRSTSLYAAIKRKQIGMVNYLILIGAQVNHPGGSYLFEAHSNELLLIILISPWIS